MAYLVVAVAACVVSALTLFSGFGLGTLLLPVFALFFPVPVAVAATAIVHLLNNLFKLALIGRHADRRVVVRFGLPALVAAIPGAWLLRTLSDLPPLLRWQAPAVGEAVVTPVELVMGLLILAFAALELIPALHRWRVAPRMLPLGGVLSGFFGGLSGHQGALRAAFLGPLGLAPAAFAASQAAIATMVDVARLLVYGVAMLGAADLAGPDRWPLVAVGTASAFAGAVIGRSLLPKLTVGLVRVLSGVLLLVVGGGLVAGLV